MGPKPQDSGGIELECVQNQQPSTERSEYKIPVESHILPLLQQLCWDHMELGSTQCLLFVFQVRLWRWEGGGHTWRNGILLLCNHTPLCPVLHPRCAVRTAHANTSFLCSHITLKLVIPQEKIQDVWMAVSMDTISIVTMWGRGEGRADGETGS